MCQQHKDKVFFRYNRTCEIIADDFTLTRPDIAQDKQNSSLEGGSRQRNPTHSCGGNGS